MSIDLSAALADEAAARAAETKSMRRAWIEAALAALFAAASVLFVSFFAVIQGVT
jgi:hypothetical protein